MDATSQPVVTARWHEDDGKYYLDTPRCRVVLNHDVIADIHDLFALSDGHSTIAGMSNATHDIPGIVLFFEGLEEVGACYDANNLALFGHHAASYPDPFRRAIPDEEIVRLMQLPSDQCNEVPIRLVGQPCLHDQSRRSVREFSSRSLSFTALSSILLAAYGITDTSGTYSRRSIPSAGAMYPLQHDLVILNCEELEPGHYQMARHSNSLYRIDSNVDLSGCMFEQSWREAAAIHIISFDVERSAKKYASRAHRFAILEAGHAAQNAIYRATAMEVGSWEYGGYFDEPLEDYCRLTAPTSGLATVIMYGHARA